MRLTIVLAASPDGAASAWSVDAQPGWNVLFLKQLACRHFGLAPADAVLTAAAGQQALDDDATVAESAGGGDDARLVLRSRLGLGADGEGNSDARLPRRQSCNLWVFCYDCEAVSPAAVAVTASAAGAAVCADCGGAEPSEASAAVAAASGDCVVCGRRGCRFRLDLACSREGPHPTGRCVLIREFLASCLDDANCCVCSERPPPDRPLLAFPCGHAACLPCFAADAAARLDGRRLPYLAGRGLTIDCPAECRHPNRYLADPHAFRLLGPEAYERFKLLGAQRALMEADAGHVMCPVCTSQYELPAVGAGGEVTCELALGGCGARICLACRELAHVGDCADDGGGGTAASTAEDAERRLSSLATIRRTSKPCPRCRAPTERDGGCMHMTCRICGLGWCWICCLEWTQQCQAAHWFG